MPDEERVLLQITTARAPRINGALARGGVQKLPQLYLVAITTPIFKIVVLFRNNSGGARALGICADLSGTSLTARPAKRTVH